MNPCTSLTRIRNMQLGSANLDRSIESVLIRRLWTIVTRRKRSPREEGETATGEPWNLRFVESTPPARWSEHLQS